MSQDAKDTARGTKSAKMILDLGAHQGQTSLYYLRKGWKAVAVEAHPKLAKRLRYMAGYSGNQPFTFVEAALAPEGDSCALLYTSSKGTNGQTHSINPERVRDCEGTPYMVPAVTLRKLFTDHGVPDYLKIDIEGADIVAIRQLHEWAGPRPERVSVELSQEHPEETLEILSHLGYMGYDRFAIVAQTHDTITDVDTAVEYIEGVGTIAWQWFLGQANIAGVWYDLHCKHKDAP